jgi:Neuraminidase-like domain
MTTAIAPTADGGATPASAAPPPIPYTASGTVWSAASAGVGGLAVELVDKNVGGDVMLGQTTTDASGAYTLSVEITAASLASRRKTKPDLQARVSAGKAFVAASDVIYNAPTSVTLNVTIPAGAAGLATEYEALTQSLAASYTGKLGALQEDGTHTDITYLANKTGWDARAVAMAALADQFSTPATPSSPSIPAPLYYALFRAGLPANAQTLYRADLGTVGAIWNAAITQGVIPAAMSDRLTAALAAFHQMSAAAILDAVTIPNASSLRAMLQVTLGADTQRQQEFATLYTQYQTDMTSFWAAVTKSFGDATSKKLQLDGQLAFLTLNNAPLMTNVYKAEQSTPITSLLDLVRRGYYQASKWTPLMTDGAQTDLIALMTAQLRLGYPTAVLAEMINSNAIPLTTDATVRSGVYQFLVQNQGSYELGLEPIDQYIASAGLKGDPAVVAQIKRLQRVYQVTPNDTAMNALLTSGVDSAYAITHYGHDAFIRAFSTSMGGADVAAATFVKAQSVYNAVLNVTTDYLIRRVTPALGNGTSKYLGPFPNNNDAASISNTGASATLGALFGSLDYCACDECRSILGPSAYLVDLLNLTNCPSPPNGSTNPQTVLFSRRPDLQYMPLTCDNTNTAQPYIDLVNETLEYFTANGSMTGYQGFSTDATATSSAELIATPQNVNQAAYTTLQSALFPPPLPFDRSLEILRLLFQKFDVNLQDAMAALRASDAVERPAGPTAYGWRDILMEEIGLSREEYQILTDSTLTLQQLYGYPSTTTAAQTITDLSVVQDYSRRLSVSYDDLLAILETHFINPHSTLVPQLESLNVPFGTIAALKNGTLTPAAFLALLPTGLDAPNPADFGGDIVAWLTDATRYAQIMGLITITNPTGGTDLCSMVGLQFRYSNPDTTANTLQPIDFLRLLRFIRLWQTLGLTIQQTDDTITALAPVAALDTAFLALLPRIGFAYRVMTMLGLSAATDIENLLPCWGPIGSLYASMFLNPAMLRQDPAFAPNADGLVLQDATQTIMASPILQKAAVGGTITASDIVTTVINGTPISYTVVAGDTSLAVLAGHIAAAVTAAVGSVVTAAASGAVITFSAVGSSGAFTLACTVSPGAKETYLSLDHAPALRAAFNLTASEFSLITQALGFDATTVLNLANISAIYRRGYLARQLKISVVELSLLTQFTGLDPFAAPDPSATPPAEPPVVRFIRLVQAMSAASLQPVQALYLLWNQDVNGTSAPTQADITALAFTLRSDFVAVDAQFTLVDDPTGAIATSLMTLVYGATATNFFFGLLNGTVTVSTAFGTAVPAAVLTASGGRLTYDNLAKQLTYAGVLDPTTLAAMESAASTNAPLLTAIAALLTANQALVNPFFAQFPELLPAYNVYVASTATSQAKRSALLANLLPSLEAKRKQEQALADVSAAAGIDASFATALFNDPTVMHAAADATQPSIIDLTAVEATGLSAAFFLTNNTALPPDQTVDNVPSLEYASGTATTLPPGNGGSAIAGIWSGYLDCPQDGFYNIGVTTDAGATVRLVIGGAPVTMTQAGGVWANSSAIALTAGDLTSFVLAVTTVKSTLQVSWQSTGTGWQPLAGRYLYSHTIVSRLGSSYTRFLKGASLATALSLEANELTFLATDADYQVGGVNWLNALPVMGNPNAATSSALTNVLTGVLTFARLKQALSPSDERFLTVLTDPSTAVPSGQSELLTLTRWDKVGLSALLTRFFGTGALTPLQHLANFARVLDAFTVVTTCGIAASSLVSATTNAPIPQTVSDFEAAVRARYAEADWLTVIQPINDTMRQKQRDALVPYALQLCAAQNAVVDLNTPVNTPDTLYEYLLMDVQMQPCMLTSRVRMALSIVQLFIERCIRGLESVDPSCFSPAQWTWMKRYRVWEANREVFLWPENWLYPELRDDQSPIFKTMMSKLLQNDITDDAATDAYLKYLSELEVIAKLEPVGTYYVPATATSSETIHVIARAAGATSLYYYRYFDGAAWAPWQQIPLAIEGDPVLPVVWNNRLLLFWLGVVKQSNTDNGASFGANANKPEKLTSASLGDLGTALAPDPSVSLTKVYLNLHWSEFYNGKWQPAKSSDPNNPAFFGEFFSSGMYAFDRSLARLAAYPDATQNRLYLGVTGDGADGTSFTFYNTHSAPVPNTPIPATLYQPDPYHRQVYNWQIPAGAEVAVSYQQDTNDIMDYYASAELILSLVNPVTMQSAMPQDPIQPDPTAVDWVSPFFYADTCNAFCVDTALRRGIIWGYPNYGVVSVMAPPTLSLAPLTLKNVSLLGSPSLAVQPINAQQNVGEIDPGPIAQFVGKDAYITRGLGTTGVIQYGNTTIGIAGGIAGTNGAAPTPTTEAKP